MEEIDVSVIVRKLVRRWYWFVLSLVVALGLAFFYLATTENQYLVSSSIQLKDKSLGEKGAGQANLLSGFELLSSNSELEDEIGVLTSYSTIHQSVESLGLEVSYHQYPGIFGTSGKMFSKEIYPAPFEVKLDDASWQLMYTPIHITFLENQQYRVRVSTDAEQTYLYHPSSNDVVGKEINYELDTVLSVKQSLKTPFLTISFNHVDSLITYNDNSYYIKVSSINDVTDHYRKQLKHEQLSENSNIVQLNLTTSAPRKDIAFLNRLNKVYINNDLKKKNRLGERTIEFIDFQLQGVADSLRNTEQSLQAFRAKSNIIDLEKTSHTLSDQLFSLEEKQAQLTVQNKYYQYMSDYLASHDDVNDIVAPSSVGIQDQLLSSLLIQLSALNEEKISKNYSSSKENPVMLVLERKIKSTKNALIDNIKNLIGSNNIALQESNRRVAEIKQTISRLPENERNLTDIKRRFTFNDNIYNYLLQKRAEAGIAIASNVPDKSIVDAPRQIGKSPIAPNRGFIIMFAVVLGLITPLGLIFVSELFNDKLASIDQLEKWTNIPLIERIALLKDKEIKNPYTGESYLAHAFRYVKHHIEYLRLDSTVKTVGITSAKSGEGKTFCALNLAITYAHAGQKTLLIEADLHHPALAVKLNVNSPTGLGEYLQQGQQPVIMNTSYKGLSFMSAGQPQENPSDLLSNPRLAAMMATLKERYDIIIVDAPPVGIVADYLQLSKHTDYTLLVVRQGVSQKDEIQRLDKLVKKHGLKCGVLYNGAEKVDDYGGYYKKAGDKKSYVS